MKEGDMMRILRISKVNTVLVGIIMMAILLCCSSQVQAAQSGDFTYTVTNGQAQITGYTGAGGVVTIPSTLGGTPVARISEQAFENCTGLSSISIPQSISQIGKRAFKNCTRLTSITIPQSVTYIGEEVFKNCMGLTSISIPESVTYIDCDAFSGCTGLTTINIPQGVTGISGYGAFSGCTGLTSITVAVDNLNYASIDGVLYNKAGTILIACPGGLTSISIPQGVTGIGAFAFIDCTGLTSISIPESVTYIEGFAFYGCTGLTSISLPQGVTSISWRSFEGCTGLISISIPKSVTDFNYAFEGCTGLTSITFNSATTKIYHAADTIPTTTKIIGYDPSTAKDYATKYNRTFEVIGATKTLQNIAITTPATKLRYTVGDTLDITGLVVIGTYSDGSTKAEPITAANITGFNSLVATTDQVLTITVGAKTITYKVQIVAAPTISVTRVSLNKSTTAITVGASEALSTIITPTNATIKDVTWKSSKTSVATVDSDGKIVGVSAGTATITVTTMDGNKTATCKVTVKSPPTIKVTKVSLNKKITTINVGANETLIPTVSPTTATNQNVTWKSSNTKIANVESNGMVTAIKAGKVTITVTTVDGKKTAKCTVTVSAIKR